LNGRPRDTWIETSRRLAPLLSADRFDRLSAFLSPSSLSAEAKQSFADCLHGAIGELDSLHHTLTNFLPRYLLDLAPEPGRPRGEILEGTFVFADVTGFTTLTGELSKRGTEGREEMNRLMCSLFAALLEPLLASGGDLLIFAGDAVLACFPGRPEGQDARWAARTALRLIQAIAPFAEFETPYGTFSLTMSAGVERGRSFAAVVGTGRRMELLISGGPVQGAMRAEGEGNPGEVIVGPGASPFLSEDEFLLQGSVVQGIKGGELSDYEPVPPARRRSRISAVFSRSVPDLIEHLQRALDCVEALVPFIPPDLFTQIARGEDIRQHPPVAVQFVNVLGVEDVALGPAGPEQAAAVLQRYFVRVEEIVADREGIVSQVDAYAKGFTFLNPFGAPTHHEGVPRLAASAALELNRALERVNREFDLDPPLAQRIGLTYDRIFTGEIGHRHRREYVVAGPGVNLAARLMSKADPGQIVLDPATWESVQEDFASDPLPPIRLKGIGEPVARFNLQGLRRGGGLRLTDYPLAGRSDELAVLERHLDGASAGQGGVLTLAGEAGVGKSRLATALAERARGRGFAVLAARCRSFGCSTPYLPWARMVDEWFEIGEDAPLETRRRQLEKALAQFDLSSSLPAVADLLGLQVAHHLPPASRPRGGNGPNLYAALRQRAEEQVDSQALGALLTDRLAEDARPGTDRAGPSVWAALSERVSIPHALRSLLERQALRQPTLVIVEDLQWMDPDSRQVLEAVAGDAQSRPLLLLLTSRPGGAGFGDEMALSPLAGAEAQALAALALRATQTAPDLAEWLMGHTKGNPLFLLAYCRALREGTAVTVDPRAGEARWSGPPPALPISVQEIMLAEVERLTEDAREVVRRAAIGGTIVSTGVLVHLCQDIVAADELVDPLDEAARRGIIAPPPPAPAYSFASQLLHEAVYTALSHASREAWHEQVGDWLAGGGEAACYERLEEIAHHYSRSADAEKAARYTRLAGDKSRARQADEAALAYYAQTLSVEGGDGIAAERQRAHEGMGDVRALRGEWEAAREGYRAALEEKVPGEETARSRLEAKLALLSPLAGPAGPGPLEEARLALPEADRLRSWLGAALCWVQAARGETDAAAATCRQMLPAVGEPLATALREALASLDTRDRLPAYADLFSLFTHTCLRTVPGGDL
jgi:class 3 adenylate cyclase